MNNILKTGPIRISAVAALFSTSLSAVCEWLVRWTEWFCVRVAGPLDRVALCASGWSAGQSGSVCEWLVRWAEWFKSTVVSEEGPE